ncbi:DUF1707 domain-containing protein [Nonomuraea pusilla]|uniref:DUF1707 SHOCT-like domain-containing protein n=1 Tax=Nonomuraea pusilla TaxID=46177 RepID=UPI00332BB04A
MDRNDLRIGDAEREQTMAALREHFAQGRLTHEELDERLDRTLAAKTVRDLAEVTGDLPGSPRAGQGPAPYAPPYTPHAPFPEGGAWPAHDREAWREAMRAHRREMRALHHRMPGEAHRHGSWAGRPPWRHRGPHPIVPVLFFLALAGLIFGGFGVFKVLLVVWVGAMLFSLVRRSIHHRR